MIATVRICFSAVSLAIPSFLLAQAGPSDPQVIATASTARINLGSRKPEGHVVATVRVDAAGRVVDALVTENTADSSLESQIVKVLQSARFRPAIDASGRPVAGSSELKVELRASTGNSPKPLAAKTDPQHTEVEKERILKMSCADFTWEWELIRDVAGNDAATEFMPRIAVSMYAALRTEAGDYVDAKVWKASEKALREAADRCESDPAALFWQGTLKPVLDEAVPN